MREVHTDERVMIRRAWPHAVVLLGLILVLLFAIMRASGRVVDLDLWHELALAREVVRLGHVPRGDLFAFTPTVSPSVNHEWGAGMIAYAVLTTGGATAVMLLNALLAAGALTLAVMHAYRRGAQPVLVAVLTLPAVFLLCRGFQPVRAQAYSFVLFGLLLLLLDRNRRGEWRWMGLWIPAFILWVNLHGSFVLAFAVLGAYALDALAERRPVVHLLSLGAAMAGLVAANPYGLAMYSHMLRTLRMARPMSPEWVPAWDASAAASVLPTIAISLALFLYGFVRSKADVAGAAIVLMTAAASLSHVKMLPYYALAWIAFVPAWLEQTRLSSDISGIVFAYRRASHALGLLGMAGVAAGLIAVPFWAARVPDAGQITFPVGPVEYLRHNRFRGNLMTGFNHGSFVIWKLYPRVKVSMDSRYDVAYPEWLCYANVRAFLNEHDCSAFVETYGADALLVERGTRLDVHFPDVSTWKRVYRDSAFSIYAREGLNLPVTDIPARSFDGTLP